MEDKEFVKKLKNIFDGTDYYIERKRTRMLIMYDNSRIPIRWLNIPNDKMNLIDFMYLLNIEKKEFTPDNMRKNNPVYFSRIDIVAEQLQIFNTLYKLIITCFRKERIEEILENDTRRRRKNI